MATLIKSGQAPSQSIAPSPIELTGLWTLDVDNNIWQDTGLVDDADDEAVAPRWLADEAVRSGIRAMLEVDRCEEELARISKERRTLQEWLCEEWAAVKYACTQHGKHID